MRLLAEKVPVEDILPFRALFLQEINAQIRYDACHVRGWTDSYLLRAGDRTVGYGSVKGKEELADRDAVFEWYVVPPFRNRLALLFGELLGASRASFIECQTNDALLLRMMHEFGNNIEADVVLFADHSLTRHSISGVHFRRRQATDRVDPDQGEYLLERAGEVVATGGFLLHYNAPFADLYMAVPEAHRRQGYGALILQELKRECYLAGRVPAARCNLDNKASKATLLRAGLKVCGFMLTGEVETS